MKLLPSVVLKLFLAAGERAADAPGGRGWGVGLGTQCWGGTGEGRCSDPSAGHLVGPVLPGRRAPALVRGDLGVWRRGLMRPRPSPAVLSALVTGESLERLRRGLAAGTGNLDSPTESTDQLLAPEGGRGREVLNLEETDLDLLRGGCEG